jgi:hypothetical protein
MVGLHARLYLQGSCGMSVSGLAPSRPNWYGFRVLYTSSPLLHAPWNDVGDGEAHRSTHHGTAVPEGAPSSLNPPGCNSLHTPLGSYFSAVAFSLSTFADP